MLRCRSVGLGVLLGVGLLCVAAPPAAADPPPAPPVGEGQSGPPAEPQAIPLTWKEGPTRIALGHDLAMDLPAGFQFLDGPQARKVLEASGNLTDERTLGLAKDETGDWFVEISFDEEGYVKDDDAAKLDADGLLTSIREGTEKANEFRKEQGFPPFHLDGWTEPPRYDKALHHLVWAIKGTSDRGSSVNFNTRVLGRRGYASLNLVAGPETIATAKPQAGRLLAATGFEPGARYEDFKPGTDKVAEYGLAALVLGGAGVAAAKAVKIGLLAKFGKVIIAALIAGKKAVAVALVGLYALGKRLLGRKTAAPAPVSSSSPPTPPGPTSA